MCFEKFVFQIREGKVLLKIECPIDASKEFDTKITPSEFLL